MFTRRANPPVSFDSETDDDSVATFENGAPPSQGSQFPPQYNEDTSSVTCEGTRTTHTSQTTTTAHRPRVMKKRVTFSPEEQHERLYENDFHEGIKFIESDDTEAYYSDDTSLGATVTTLDGILGKAGQAIEKINEYLSPKPSQKTISSSSSDIKPPRHSPPSPSKSSPPRSALRSPDRDPSPYVDFPVTQAALESDEWERLKELQTDMEGEGRKRTWQGQFEIGNGLVVLQDIALDMAHQALNMPPHLSPSEILSLQKPSANKYANFVGRDEELPPSQVANMLDMARGLTLMEDWVQKNPESEIVVDIMELVLYGIILNKHVIAVCDTLHVASSNASYFVSGFDYESDEDSIISRSESEQSDARSVCSAISDNFKATTFSTILQLCFKIIQRCTKSTLVYHNLTSATKLCDVVKTLLCYISGGNHRYFIQNHVTEVYYPIPIPQLINEDAIRVYSLLSLLEIVTPSPVLNVLRRSKGSSNGTIAKRLLGKGSSPNERTFAKEFSVSEHCRLDANLPIKLRKDIAASMLKLQRKFSMSKSVMERSFEVLSRLLTYNYVIDGKGSKKGNETISLFVRDSFNSSRDAGNEMSRLAIEMGEDMVQQEVNVDIKETENIIISILRVVRKVLLYSSSRSCKIHGMRIFNVVLVHFLKTEGGSAASMQFQRYEAALRDIVLSNFMVKPVLGVLEESYEEIIKHTFRCDEEPDFLARMSKDDKKALSRDRTLICLTSMFVRNLSTSKRGRQVVKNCEIDAKTAADEQRAQSKRESSESGNSNEDEKKALLRPTLFTGIIGWSLNELKPSYQDSARGVDSPELLKESLHFLRNNTGGLYPTTQHETGGNLMLDLFWESFDIYYSPAHDGVWFKEEGDDGAGMARRKGPLQYDLAEVRPVNSILAYNLSCTLLEFCADIDTMVFVLASETVLNAILFRYLNEERMTTPEGEKDAIYTISEANVRRAAKYIVKNLRVKSEQGMRRVMTSKR
ncbi:hypothetical protein TrVE_jg13135 [Triparma verrucosa]|uniref:Uncharacterized protein n=1 Tax=Triparma verrucosa TaxID=1606542 RepID=A0A9W7CFE3_9STRA|nr:hypothetical protein TrVE_jg13135 [Triparma verrucosa]